MKIVHFKIEHVEIAEIKSLDAEIFNNKNITKLLAGHTSGTFIMEGRIVAFAGMYRDPKDRDTGIVWLVPTIYTRQYFVSVSKYMMNYLDTLAATFELKKLRTPGHDDKIVLRWLKWLGFKEVEPLVFEREM